MLKISFESAKNLSFKALALTVAQSDKAALLGEEGLLLDKKWQGLLSATLKASPSFKGEEGKTLLLYAPDDKGVVPVLLIGIGKTAEADALVYERVGARVYAALAKDDLHTYQQACKMKATMRARQEGVRALAVQQVDEAREKVAKLEADLNAERDFLHVLGKDGFLGAIFGEVLAEISSEANSILSKLQNTSHVSVALTTENAKGKKTITPVFYVDGNEATRHSGLSGGMGASADLAVDLGVVGVIERRLGQVPGWLALDESFNGMPRSTKESAIEILQQFAQDRLVLVVDHGSEMKAHFNKVLTVKLENGKSVAG